MMKKSLGFLVVFICFFAFKSISQNGVGIYLQAVARDIYANPAKDRKIYVKTSIIQSTPNGTAVLIEEFQTQTDAIGIFGVSIGLGTRVGGTKSNLSNIDWANGPYYINMKVAISPLNASSDWDYTKEWNDLGTSPFGTVPYALYAGTANGLDTKLNIGDTTKMLSPYAKVSAFNNLSTTVSKLSSTISATLDSNAILNLNASKLNIKDSLTTYVTPFQFASNSFDTSSIYTQLSSKELSVNKSTDIETDATSDVKFPTVKAVKTFVDSKISTSTTPSGVTSVNAISSSSNVNGASISGTSITLTPADLNNGGIVTSGTQTFGGTKTFSNDVTINEIIIGRKSSSTVETTIVGANNAGGSGTGKRNTAIGYGTLRSYTGTAFDNNTGIGYNNMGAVTTGQQNTSIGAETLLNLRTGNMNTAIGSQTLINTTGSNNTAIGYRAGETNTTGSNVTLLGYGANVGVNNLSNATAIGASSTVSASNTIQLGNTSVTNVKTSGTITAGVVTYPKTDGTNGQVLTTNGTGTLGWATPTIGVTSVSAINATSNANGATISGTSIILTPADATNGGIITTGTQTIGGDKIFNGKIQIGAGTSDASAALDIQSTTQGILFPRLTTTQRDAIVNPAIGLTVYNTTTGSIESYLGKTSSATITNTTDRGGWYAPVSPSTYDAMMHYTRPSYAAAQSFIPNSICSITDIEVYVNNVITAGTFNLKLFSGSGISGTLLSNQTITFSNVGFQKVSLTNPVALTSGQTYTFEVSSVTGNINIGLNDNYASGNFFQNGNSSNNDLMFKLYISNIVGSWKGSATGSSATLPLVDGTAGQILTTNGSGTASWTNASSGITTVGVINGTSNANGATISGTAIILTPADANNGGIVTSSAQTLGGSKSFISNVRVGTTTPSSSAVLEASSTSQGFLPPRMTASQRDAISSPAVGLMVYCTNCGTYGEPQYFNGNSWMNFKGIVQLPQVTINTQIWSSVNLNVSQYRNGDIIPQVTDPTEWRNLTTGAWCWYNNDSTTYAAKYGKLYNWYAVNDPRGLAPDGWHIPTDAEWTTLANYLGGASVAGGAMKQTGTTLWNDPNTGATNSSGFSGLPGGLCSSNGIFYNVGSHAFWWSATTNDASTALRKYLYSNDTNLYSDPDYKTTGNSVRCVKD